MITDYSIEDIWQELIASLRKNLSTPGFETFKTTAQPISFNDGVLVIGVPNEFTKNWLKERVELLIKSTIKNAFFISVMVDFQVSSEAKKSLETVSVEEERRTNETKANSSSEYHNRNNNNASNSLAMKVSSSNLNSKYTFESFVVGQSNRFAHAATIAVSSAPGKAYNPLFIYGGVGLGKTHLMHAIGMKAMENNPDINVLYVSSETFTNELINAIRDDKTAKFREKYRNIDVLLIDDIQFLAGKERTQEEFFHTFNSLHEYNKQIVISSDRPPKDIPTLEDRLKSRFDWGLSTDIQAPELETRIAILKKKAELEGLEIPINVLNFIATQIPSNIRELEGALIRIIAYASLINSQISIELASDVIKDIIIPKQNKPVTIDLIKKTVASYFNITVDNMCSKTRTKDLAMYRQIAMYLARDLTNTSLPNIGKSFGGRDHTTVMYACDKVKEMLEIDEVTKNSFKDILTKLGRI